MQKIPECRSMNFSIYEGMLNRYKDSEDIRKSYESRGLNGLEVIREMCIRDSVIICTWLASQAHLGNSPYFHSELPAI